MFIMKIHCVKMFPVFWRLRVSISYIYSLISYRAGFLHYKFNRVPCERQQMLGSILL